ncbi:MAG: HD domain-containing protein [Dermatophilaceae bacterium]
MAASTPDDELRRQARERLASAPAILQRHSLRMAALAEALADREGLDVDRAGLFCACAFHDLGTLVGGSGPFPVRSARLLDAFLTEHGVGPGRRDPLVAAVRGHLAPAGIRWVRPAQYAGPVPEVTLLRRVAWLDALAVGDRQARGWRRTLRGDDGDPVLDVRLTARLAAACAVDLLGAVRAAWAGP